MTGRTALPDSTLDASNSNVCSFQNPNQCMMTVGCSTPIDAELIMAFISFTPLFNTNGDTL